MFDISWSEFLLIGVVALVVIGPKELPGVMRTLGQWTRKVRSMASEFQNQFHEAMREAEMADLKQQVDDMARDVAQIDPLKSVRDDVDSFGRDVQTSLSHPAGVDTAVELPAPEPLTELPPPVTPEPVTAAAESAAAAELADAAAPPAGPDASAAGTAKPEVEATGRAE